MPRAPATATSGTYTLGQYALWDERAMRLQNRYVDKASRIQYEVTHTQDYSSLLYDQLRLPPAAPWLPLVERRIEDSMVPDEYSDRKLGAFLSETSGNAALKFFRSAADVLPGEPYLYSSTSGDVVAEFRAAHGSMTTVIAPDKVLVFAVVDKEPTQLVIKRGSNSFREDLRGLKLSLIGRADGSLGTVKQS